MTYSRWKKKPKKKSGRKKPVMKVAHKNMLKGAGVIFALLIFKPSIPINLAQKVQEMLGGAK